MCTFSWSYRARPGIKASSLFFLGQYPEMLKSVYLFPLPQSWTCFKCLLSNVLQMLSFTSAGTCAGNQWLGGGWGMWSIGVGCPCTSSEVGGSLQVIQLKQHVGRFPNGVCETVSRIYAPWWDLSFGYCAPRVFQPLSHASLLSIPGRVREMDRQYFSRRKKPGIHSSHPLPWKRNPLIKSFSLETEMSSLLVGSSGQMETVLLTLLSASIQCTGAFHLDSWERCSHPSMAVKINILWGGWS